MDLVSFHQGLLGRDPSNTPELVQVSPRQRQLYEAYPQGRGFSTPPDEPLDGELFLGTLVLALAQTSQGKKGHRVHLFAPHQHEPWMMQWTREVVSYAARLRHGDRKGLAWLLSVVKQVRFDWTFLQVDEEPAHWTAFGLHKTAPGLPEWISDTLIEVDS